MNSRTASLFAKSVIALILILTLGAGGVIAAELALFLKWDVLDAPREAVVATPEFDRLRAAYRPFIIQYVNPIYLFFYPFDPAARVALSNDVSHITADGYRGAGPEAAGKRRLAFLLGGSAAFGLYATDDSTTITGYLNRIQDQYFFVNAGVSSWNSTQELARLTYQVLDAQPHLVVAYDGSNDLGNTLFYHRKGLSYPAGTPESFDDLEELVGDIRGERRRTRASLFSRVLPRLSVFVQRRFGDAPPVRDPYESLPSDVIEASARKYVRNVSFMNDLARAQGVRFIGVFQPIYPVHRHAPESLLTTLMPQYGRSDFTRYHDFVMGAFKPRFEYLDFGALFDPTYDTVPLLDRRHGPDMTAATIFVDAVHLADAGNRRVAEALWDYLRQHPK